MPIRTISSRVIEDATVAAADIAAGTITQDKLSANSFNKNIFDSSTLISLQNDSIILDGTNGASANAGDNIVFDTAADVNDRVLINEAKNPDAAPGVYESALLHVVDEKANNTSSQTFSTGQNTRELTTVKTNEITGASLGSNQITLPSGTYFAQAEANGYVNARHKISLYNTTDASYTLVGLSSNSHASYYTTSPSMLSGRFTISAQKVFELRHYIQSGSASGIATNASLVEVYANVRIWKVA